MIVTNRATLAVYSDEMSATAISEVLGIQPHSSNERGDPTAAALAGIDVRTDLLTHQRAHWSFDADLSDVDPDDGTGFGALRALIEAFRSKFEALNDLKPRCELIVWWSGYSDSDQGGFVIPADLLVDLAAMGCDLYGTAYLDDSRDGVSSAEIAAAWAAEGALLRGEIRTDSSALDGLLAENFHEIRQSGIHWGRASTISALVGEDAGGRTNATIDERRTDQLAADVVLLTYRLEVGGRRSRRASIWKFVDGAPLIEFHQGTPTE
jgi:hypothetical protein